MAINKNHEFEELDGVKCAIVERNVSQERVNFLKELLEFNKYKVVIVASIPKAPLPVAAAPVATVETLIDTVPPPPPPADSFFSCLPAFQIFSWLPGFQIPSSSVSPWFQPPPRMGRENRWTKNPISVQSPFPSISYATPSLPFRPGPCGH